LISRISRAALSSSGGIFDPSQLESQLAEYEKEMSSPSFWDNQKNAQKVSQQATRVRESLESYGKIRQRVEDLPVLIELSEEEGESAAGEVEKEYTDILQTLDALEIKILLKGETDPNNAIISIHAGAGGTEACDWANMLWRMYQRWVERRGFSMEMLDYQQGEEAGIKGVTFLVKGEYAYGYLKAERGVHRLVRISPFNAAGKRQTSFASLDVVAEIDEDIEIEVADSDIRVMSIAPGAREGRGSIPPTPLSDSPTCPPDSSLAARTSVPKSRTGPAPCGY
jgi:peptide chain release factor 2